MKNPKPFSDQLENWLKAPGKKTIEDLDRVFGAKSFAVVFLVLMFIPALPLPTGGITHVLEIIVMLLSLELIIGRKTIWLPKRWRNKELGATLKNKTIPFIMRRVRWFERFSRPRFRKSLQHSWAQPVLGVLVLGLTLAAFLAPPFSGLDTLPSLGVVIISLSVILGDAVILLIGILLGIAGVILEIGFGEIIVHGIHRIFG